MNRLALLASGLSLVIGSCANQGGASATEGNRISRLTIRQEGPGSIDEARLRSFITSKEGSTYSSDQIDTDIKSLYESGLVDDVRFRTEPDGDQVKLIVETTIRTPVGPGVGFVGNTLFSDQMLAQVTQIKQGDTVTPKTVARARQNISAFYLQHGHKATVTARGKDLIFVIQEHFTAPG